MYETPAIIKELGALLRQPINFETEFLETQIIELEALRYDLAVASADWLKLLHEKRKQMLWPKDADKGLTELDRHVRLDGDLAPIERDHELLKKLEILVEERLSLALQLLKTRDQL